MPTCHVCSCIDLSWAKGLLVLSSVDLMYIFRVKWAPGKHGELNTVSMGGICGVMSVLFNQY